MEIYKTIFQTGDYLLRINVRDQMLKKYSLFSNNFFIIVLSATLFSPFWRLILAKPDQTWTPNVNIDILTSAAICSATYWITDITVKDKEKQLVDRSLLLGKVPWHERNLDTPNCRLNNSYLLDYFLNFL